MIMFCYLWLPISHLAANHSCGGYHGPPQHSQPCPTQSKPMASRSSLLFPAEPPMPPKSNDLPNLTFRHFQHKSQWPKLLLSPLSILSSTKLTSCLQYFWPSGLLTQAAADMLPQVYINCLCRQASKRARRKILSCCVPGRMGVEAPTQRHELSAAVELLGMGSAPCDVRSQVWTGEVPRWANLTDNFSW